MSLRGGYKKDSDKLYIFRDGSPVTQTHIRAVLKEALKNLGLNAELYNFTSLCIGRASDLQKFGVSIEKIKRMGRWKSNTVYKYIRPV